MPGSSDGAHPIPVLIVATWYPGVDDPGRGRFVADQAEALRTSGRADPLVVSFDVAYADGLPAARRARAVTEHLRGALASRDDVVSPGGWLAPSSIGTARLPTPEPYGKASLAPGQEADLRREALELLAERLRPTVGARGVVHAHTAYPDGYAAVGAARTLGWPLVITEHASFVARQLRNPEHRRRYLEAAGAATRFVAVSDSLAAELRTMIPEVEHKLEVIPNVVQLDEFEIAGHAERSPDELLFIGNRKERKGMVVLLRAFADILEERPAATLRLIGKSSTYDDEARWHRLADDLGIAHAVSFEEPIDRAGVALALRRASIFVHPSYRETFGVVTLEALASGLPVVATQSGGISPILEDARLGALVPPQDPRMLARAVLRALARRDEFDPQALRRAVQPFSADAVAARLGTLYDDALRDADGAPSGPPAGRTVAWAGKAAPVVDVVVVAHDADRAARALARMPAAVLSRLSLVTEGVPENEHLPAGIGRIVHARAHVEDELRRRGLGGPRGSLRERLLRLAMNPVAPLRRRLVAGGPAELRWRASVTGMRRALGEIPLDAPGGSVPEVVCLDVVDYDAAAPLVAAARLRAAPGGVLWLADRWASGQGDEAPPREAAGAAAAAPASPSAVG